MKTKRFNILFEDDNIIVVDKPAPFLTIPDRFDKTIPSLLGILSAKRSEIFINHRLDKETSGVILLSKNAEAHRHISLQFESRSVTKIYEAIVHGMPIEEVGQIDLAISSSPRGKRGMIINFKGKPSSTKFRILRTWKHFSHLEIKTLTGRQHQIRVHMKAIGCPLVVDNLYGDGKAFYLSDIKRKVRFKKEEQERPLLKRMGLHAAKLKFMHPLTRKELIFESVLPKDMKAVINQLNKL